MVKATKGNAPNAPTIKAGLGFLTSTAGVISLCVPADARGLSDRPQHPFQNTDAQPQPTLDQLLKTAKEADPSEATNQTHPLSQIEEEGSAPTPQFAQIEVNSEPELPTEIEELAPPQPLSNQIINEGIQEEAAGELDNAIIRSAPQPLFEAETTYQIQVAPLEDPQVSADKRSTIKIGGSITTTAGQLLDSDIVVTLTASAGEFINADYDIDRVGFQVLARRGQFEAELRSTLDAQRVLIRASAARNDLISKTPQPLDENIADNAREIEAYTEVSFTTDLRPSLVTGVIDLRLGNASTNFWGSFEDFLNPEDIDETAFDARTSVFGTGAIGDWLFTGAYNSDRNLNERCDDTRLYTDIQACEQTYPVYGDSSTNDYLTPSIDSLYLRLQQDANIPEAEPNYFMWGDYSTNEFSRPSQLFTATSRQLHGFMGNYTLGSLLGGDDSGLQLTAMYANNIRPFKRDTIAPDGTSGFYFLSEPLVLAGSEEIYIETEELNRPGTVVERVALTRGADYRIDYDRGAILFTQPVAATDANPFGPPLVRRIVASYQVEGDETGGELFGGRAQYNFSYDLDAPSWIGASIITEDDNVRDFTLYGADALISLGDNARIIGELAQSDLSGTPNSDGNGTAYRLEASGEIGDNFFARAYVRGADSEFSNTATTSFRPGQTRWGAELSALLGETTQLDFQYDQEENRGTAPAIRTGFEALRNPGFFPEPGASVDNSLTTIRAGIQQEFGNVSADLAYVYRDRNDRTGDFDATSSQLVSGLTVPLADNLSFRAQNELNLGGDEDPIYPGRTVFGLDYQPFPEVTLRLAHQFFNGSDVAPDAITSLDTLLDYDIGNNTQLTGRYSVLGANNGMTGQGAVGLNHRWNIAPGLNMDLGYERVIGDGLGVIGTGERFEQPFAVGQSAAALGLVPGSSYTVGLEYLDNPDFKASARAEYRDNDRGDDNTVITASIAGKLSRSLTALGRFEYANYANQTFTDRFDDTSSLKLGMAYRNPRSDRFNALLSYEYATNPTTTINTPGDRDLSEHTFAAEAIYAPNYKWELYGKYGLRYTDANLASVGLDSLSNTIHLAQLRAAYKFAYRWDLVSEVRYISQPSVNYDETAFALETGYYVTPDLRLGVGYSFGEANDRSFQGSGSRDDGGFYLAATYKINELFGGFGRQDVAPPQQTESEVDEIAVSEEIFNQPAASTTTEEAATYASQLTALIDNPLLTDFDSPPNRPPSRRPNSLPTRLTRWDKQRLQNDRKDNLLSSSRTRSELSANQGDEE